LGLTWIELKEIILDKTVEIQSAKANTELLVSLQCENTPLFTYEDRNSTSLGRRIALSLICIAIVGFFALYQLLQIYLDPSATVVVKKEKKDKNRFEPTEKSDLT
jgi:hypothetical protein